MGGVDIVVKRAASYHLDCKSSMRFYLRFFFYVFIDVSCTNVFIVYSVMHQNYLTLLDYKTIVSSHFIGRYTNFSSAPQEKLDQRENISTILSLTICHRISLNFNTAENVVNTASKRNLIEKLSWNALSVLRFCALLKVQSCKLKKGWW